MHRNMGVENMMSAISQDSLKNLNIAENLCRSRRPVEAIPYLEKAMNDPRNLDAWVQLAFLAPDLEKSTQVLLNAETQGKLWCGNVGKKYLKKDLGPTCFDDGDERVGNFWGIMATRPYMRTLQALIRIHQENKRFDKAAEVGIEMLRLCPGDNLSVRSHLGTSLLKSKRYSDALSFAQTWIEYEGHPEPPRGGCIFLDKDYTPPKPEPLTEEEYNSLSSNKWMPAAFLYTAALATFRLWGDKQGEEGEKGREMAKQYLINAARLNSHVMLKVLGRIDQPKTVSDSPRSRNDTEDAHDYLWASQDLWMEPDVWAWADSIPEVKAFVLKECSRPECSTREEKVAQFKRCGSCHKAWYCGPACQKGDWGRHKADCQRHTQMRKMFKAMRAG
ncbi:hypothetical protein BDY19DRAFT_983379 [Irpex rosettiformis]|uniref:Uncharacterized protein n=1 Tax=Irpex rosettiformis TaxID=378272 RepID=A0ACB8UEX2_9APHY|nr:hypothetical protein BDY19DRAFT_983379 [Irpex rosettiformis]